MTGNIIKAVSLLLSLTCLFAAAGIGLYAMDNPSAAPAEIRFFVAVDGDDNNPGTLEYPFRSIYRARDSLRTLRISGGLTCPATVMVRGGTYYLSESVIFSGEDSGTEECPIVYRAYPGEVPVLSGGRKLTGWKPYKGKIMQCMLPEVKSGRWFFRQLFFNGKRQIRARYPDFDPRDPLYGGWTFIEKTEGKTSFRYENGTFARGWEKPDQGEINIFPWRCWNNDIIPIKKVDHDRRIISLSRPVIHRLNQAVGKLDFQWLMAGNRYYVENMLEELDQPGEWCLDRETGVLYFWPPEGSHESKEISAPALSRLIEFRGSTGEPVRHIKISGLTFTQTLSLYPQPDILPPARVFFFGSYDFPYAPQPTILCTRLNLMILPLRNF